MKISRLKKDVLFGMSIGQEIKRDTSRDDMKVARCILGRDENNVLGVLKFLNIFPSKINKAVKIGILIELNK